MKSPAVFLTQTLYARMLSLPDYKWTETPVTSLTVREYVALAEEHDWDLSHDVNYIYAKDLYPAQDLMRRICRMTGWHEYVIAAFELAEKLGTTFEALHNTVHNTRRNFGLYVFLLNELSRWEHHNGCSDAIEIER